MLQMRNYYLKNARGLVVFEGIWNKPLLFAD